MHRREGIHRSAPYRASSSSTDKAKIISSTRHRCEASGMATPAPVKTVRYAAMHIGHFGSSNSSVPEPIVPPALRHPLRRDRCSFCAVQQVMAIRVRSMPLRVWLLIAVMMPDPCHGPRQAFFIAATSAAKLLCVRSSLLSSFCLQATAGFLLRFLPPQGCSDRIAQNVQPSRMDRDFDTIIVMPSPPLIRRRLRVPFW